MQAEPNAPDYFAVRLVAARPNRAKCFQLLKDILKCNPKEAKTHMDSGKARLTTSSQLMINAEVRSFEAIRAQIEWIPASRPGWLPPRPMTPRLKE